MASNEKFSDLFLRSYDLLKHHNHSYDLVYFFVLVYSQILFAGALRKFTLPKIVVLEQNIFQGLVTKNQFFAFLTSFEVSNFITDVGAPPISRRQSPGI